MSLSTELISIIVPIFNAEMYLSYCIDSILAQSYENIEILLIDDGSNDESGEICKSYSKKDSRIRVIFKDNTGVSDTRNIGILQARGKYICFVDSDDLLKCDCVEKLFNALVNNGVDAVFCNYEYDYNGNRIKKQPRMKEGNYHTDLINNIIIDDGTLSGILLGSVCGAIYAKKMIIENKILFKRNVKVNEDGIFNILFCMHANSIRYLGNDYLYIYRIWKVSKINDLNSKTEKFEIANKAIIETLNGQNFIEDSLNRQMGARSVSIAFWQSCSICEAFNMREAANRLLKLWNTHTIIDGYKYINDEKIHKYKKLFLQLMKCNKYRTFYVAIRYVYPFAQRILTR